MDGTGPNAPVMNLDDFFGNGITLAQYERKEEPQEHKQPEAQAMNVDLIDMNAFVMDEEEEKTEASSQQPQATIQNTDFLQDEDVLLRDHSEATVLISNPHDQEEKPKINLTRQTTNVIPDDSGDFLKTSRVWRCLACLKLGDYSKYFNVSTKDVGARLKYTLYGHYLGMARPSFINEQTYSGMAG